MKGYGIYSYIVMKIKYEDTVYGYVMFADGRSTRMWQADEKAVQLFYTKLFANYFRFEDK